MFFQTRRIVMQMMNRKGFTVIQLVIVVAIAALLCAMFINPRRASASNRDPAPVAPVPDSKTNMTIEQKIDAFLKAPAPTPTRLPTHKFQGATPYRLLEMMKVDNSTYIVTVKPPLGDVFPGIIRPQNITLSENMYFFYTQDKTSGRQTDEITEIKKSDIRDALKQYFVDNAGK